GELLALRLPREAVTLLDLAASWFNEAGDPAGALFAAIAATLARQRARMAVRPDRVQFLSDAYEAVARQPGASLPAWADLARQRVFLEPRRLEPVMGGWLPRLAACLSRRTEADGAARAPVSDTLVRNMLEARLGSVPAELDPSVSARRPSRWRRRPAHRRPRQSRWRWFFKIIFYVFGAACTFGTVFVVATALLGSHLSARAQSTGVEATVDVGLIDFVIAAGGVLVALIAWTLVWRRARRWARAVVGLRITPSPGTGATADDIRVNIEKWQADPARLLPWKRPKPTRVTDSAVLPPLRAYERSAAALPASLQDGLRELASLVGPRRSVRVSLDIDPALERMPWEALLSSPVLTGDLPLPGALDFWRRGEPLAATGRPRRAQPPVTVAVLADTTRRLFAERAGLARSVSFPDLSRDNVNRVIERASTLATDPPDIVLVIGRPVRLRGAVLLQTAEQGNARGTSDDELREAVVGGGLLEPQVVAGMQARLFIAMGSPGETGGRFDTERRDTADLRGWAADLFRAGAATVIMLPSMDPERAEAVLGKIASHIRKGMTADRVYEAVRAARISAATPAQPAAADRPVEQALDICLFRRDRTPAFTVPREP
ncbi:MAG: hypothetical protein WAK82_38730, partial [Streptosporangiaceae bacterium]